MTQLTAHFSLEELTATSHRFIDNTPPAEAMMRLRVTALQMELVRRVLGDRPIHVNSGYRSPALNQAVGGVPASAHLAGDAVDFICPSFGSPLMICLALKNQPGPPLVAFDQVIQEGTWVHISFAPAMRGEVLTKTAAGGYAEGLRA